MSKIIHYRKKCIGCGACAVVCPNFFEMDKDGFATLKNSQKIGENFELEVDKVDCIQDSSDACPVKIIEITQ